MIITITVEYEEDDGCAESRVMVAAMFAKAVRLSQETFRRRRITSYWLQPREAKDGIVRVRMEGEF